MGLLIRVVVIVFVLIAYTGNNAAYGRYVSDSVRFERYDKSQGLVHPFIRSVAQDHQGYMWIGTSEGLHRYDGMAFDVFRNQPEDSLSIPSNGIRAIYADSSGNSLWLGTNKGSLVQLNLANYHFSEVTVQGETEQAYGGLINALFVEDGWAFVGTSQKIFAIEISSGKVQILFPGKVERNIRVNTIQNVYGRKLVGTSDGVFEISGSGVGDNPFHLVETSVKTDVLSISEWTYGSMLITSPDELMSVDERGQITILKRREELQSYLTGHVVDNQNNIWIGTRYMGLYYFQLRSGEMVNFAFNPGNPLSLPDNDIKTLFFLKDQSILWIGTKNGLAKYDYNRIKFKAFDLRELSDSPSPSVYMLFKDSERTYWFSTFDGLYSKRVSEQKFSKFDTNYQIRFFTRMAEDNSKNLWIGSFDGIINLDLSTGRRRLIRLSQPGINSDYLNRINGMIKGDGDALWLSTDCGVVRYNTKSDTYDYYPLPHLFMGNGHYRLTDIALAGDSVLWIGSQNGILFRLDAQTGEFQWFQVAEGSGSFLQSNHITKVTIDKNGRIWLGTYGSGLLRFDEITGKADFSHAKDFLASDIFGVISDCDGRLWISNNFGVCVYEPDILNIRQYETAEGTFCSEFNEGAFYQSPDNQQVMFGGSNGFVEFNPCNFKFNTFVPPVRISSYAFGFENVMLVNQGFLDVKYDDAKEIKIERGNGEIVIFPGVLSYSMSSKNRFAWKLEGYDTKWDTALAIIPVRYTNLTEGTYRFLYKGSNSDGVWSDEVNEITIKVIPPFFESRLFRILIVILIVIILVFLYYLGLKVLLWQKKRLEVLVKDRTQELELSNFELEQSREEIWLQKQELENHRSILEHEVKERTLDLLVAKEKAEESDRLKTAFLANLSHEVRTPMNAIIGFSNLLADPFFSEDDKKSFIKIIQDSGESLLVLINDILDVSLIEAGQLKTSKKKFLLKPFLDSLFRIAAIQFRSNNLDFSVYSEEIADNDYIVTDAERLKQVLFNFINNARKFTSEGFVSLTVRKVTRSTLTEYFNTDPNDLPASAYFFLIQDSGIGIDDASFQELFIPFRKLHNKSRLFEGIGLGLSISKRLITLLNGDVWLTSQKGKGTTFYFYLPDHQ